MAWPACGDAAQHSAKTKLVAWVVSNWKKDSLRVHYYKLLKPHLQVDVYGRFHTPPPYALMAKQLSQYKFYLALRTPCTRLHHREVVEECPAGMGRASGPRGPSRANHEQFLPPKAFIHVDDFQSPETWRVLASTGQGLRCSYLNYFRWRETLRSLVLLGPYVL